MYSLVELYTINPAVGFDQAIGSTLKQLYNSLFRYVGNPPTVEPWLARSYTVSEDGKTYTVALRQDATFQRQPGERRGSRVFGGTSAARRSRRGGAVHGCALPRWHHRRR